MQPNYKIFKYTHSAFFICKKHEKAGALWWFYGIYVYIYVYTLNIRLFVLRITVLSIYPWFLTTDMIEVTR